MQPRFDQVRQGAGCAALQRARGPTPSRVRRVLRVAAADSAASLIFFSVRCLPSLLTKASLLACAGRPAPFVFSTMYTTIADPNPSGPEPRRPFPYPQNPDPRHPNAGALQNLYVKLDRAVQWAPSKRNPVIAGAVFGFVVMAYTTFSFVRKDSEFAHARPLSPSPPISPPSRECLPLRER